MDVDLSRLPVPVAAAIRNELQLVPHLAKDVVQRGGDLTHVVTIDDEGVARLTWVPATAHERDARAYARQSIRHRAELKALQAERAAVQAELAAGRAELTDLKKGLALIKA